MPFLPFFLFAFVARRARLLGRIPAQPRKGVNFRVSGRSWVHLTVKEAGWVGNTAASHHAERRAEPGPEPLCGITTRIVLIRRLCSRGLAVTSRDPGSRKSRERVSAGFRAQDRNMRGASTADALQNDA